MFGAFHVRGSIAKNQGHESQNVAVHLVALLRIWYVICSHPCQESGCNQDI